MDREEPGATKTVIYLGADLDLAEGLRPYLIRHEVWVTSCTQVAAAAAALRGASAGLLMIDVRVAGRPPAPAGDLAGILQELAGVGRPLKWVCIADTGDLAARLAAVRGGALACYGPLASSPDLATRLLGLFGIDQVSPTRVLVVDDQPFAAMLAGGILNRAGMEVRTAFDAMKVLDALEDFRPDIIVMDMYMPGASGVDLARVIRAHEEFFAIPLVFLSGEDDRQRQMDALAVGADGFLSKPVDPELLVDTIRRRIELARSMRYRHTTAALRDPVTRLWSRGYLLQRIDRAIVDGAAEDAGQGVIYIHIGPSANLNALREAGALDEFLGLIGQAVRDATGPNDIAARLGERSLGLLLRRPDAGRLEACADGLRRAIATNALAKSAVKLTAAIGVGLFQPPADDAITMISRAKTACAKARQSGGDRVVTYVPALPRGDGAPRSARVLELIREALAGDGFRLLYQPVIPVQKRRGERYAGVLRLRTPDGELIPPFEFLPVAGQFGLMPAIDRWVLSHALDDILERCGAQPGLLLMLRQTMATAAMPDWAPWLREEIGRRDLIRHRPAIIFDLDDVHAHRRVAGPCFEALKRLGIEMCLNRMDESLEALDILAQFPWSTVRLGRETLTDMDGERLSALVDTVHGQGALAIATGIEETEAISRVWNCGVDFIEGNFIQAANEAMDFDFAGTELL